jgi:hypothetical protein
LDLAAMLSPLGIVTIPHDLIVKQANDEPLLANERDVLQSVPAVAHRLLQNIPRMQEVAQIVLYQNKNYDGSGYPKDEIKGEQIPMGSRLLRVLTDIIQLEDKELLPADIVTAMRRKSHLYDPHLLDMGLGTITQAQATVRKTINIFDIHTNMILAQDICMLNGALLVRSGQIISNTLKERLLNYFFSQQIGEKIVVLAAEDQVQTTEEKPAKPSLPQGLVSDDGYIN